MKEWRYLANIATYFPFEHFPEQHIYQVRTMHVQDPAAESLAVLIVDDDERNRKLLQVFMQAEGYRTIIAATGREAIALAVTERPHLVLLDMMMPDMDGFDVASALKGSSDTASIPLVMVSSLDDIASHRRALTAGVEIVLRKPVDRWELVEQVSRLFKKRAGSDA